MRVELTLPALERLIGGETEIEVHLRQQIVENFTKHHLKTILHDATWAAAHREWSDEMAVEIKRVLAEYRATRDERDAHLGNMRGGLAMKAEIESAIKRAVAEVLQSAIEQQTRQMKATVQAAVDNAMKFEIARQIEIGIKQRLQDALNKT